MIKNYLIIAFRNIFKSKLLSAINIFGLGFGIGAAFLIGLFVLDELTYDQFHTNVNRIYRPWTKGMRGEQESINTATPFSMGKQLAENYEEVEKYTVFTSFNEEVEKGDQSFNENINVASKDFFEIFTFRSIDGSLTEAFSDPKYVVITKEMAEKYFGSQSVAGEELSINVGGELRIFEVKAVIENIPSNSSLRFDFLVSDYYLKDVFPERMLNSWFMITGDNYLLLSEGADPTATSSKFSSLVEQVLGERLDRMSYNIYLQPLSDMHLNVDLAAGNTPTMDPKYIAILGAIAALVLTIACINFITLSLGRSITRAKEIGIRKSIGAGKNQLVLQFIGEAVLISVIATIIGVLLAVIGLPLFNELSGKELILNWNVTTVLGLVALSGTIGILAGLYPAFIMAGFNPVNIIKGNLDMGKGKNTLSKALVTGQFVMSIFLITTTLLMKDQLSFLQNKNLGFDKEHVLVVPLNVSDARGLTEQVTKGTEKGKQYLRMLEGKSSIVSTAITSHTFESGNWTDIGFTGEDEARFNFFYNTVTADYIPTLGIELVEGRNFDKDNSADETRSIIVNESFVKEFDLENPIGARIPNDNFMDHVIIGVVKDFHIESLHVEIAPLVLSQNVMIGFSGAHAVGVGSSPMPKVIVRVVPNKTQEAITTLRNTWNEVYAGEPFDYSFIDENLKDQYVEEANFGRIMSSATALAVIIGCLGLFGLSTLTMSARLREISIRKVLGASGKTLLITLNKSFIILIVIALFIASPFTYYAINDWLSGFEYRIEITPWLFLAAGVLTILVSLITVSFQTIQAIRVNPANVLRSE